MRRASLVRIILLSIAVATLGTLACSGGGGGSPTSAGNPPSSNPSQIVVEVQDDAFSPKSISVQPGDTVVWHLSGSATAGHTVTDNGGAFDSGHVFTSAGATFQHTFTSTDAGKTFEYHCQTHYACCMMQGSVRVGANAPSPSPGY
jgi:plastocyanin